MDDRPDRATPPAASSRWNERTDVARGETYDARWARLAAQGESVHGEADLVHDVALELRAGSPGRILDAGCGTGRVAVELAARGHQVLGVDLDPAMLAAARRKAPDLTWLEADLASLDLDERFDVVVLAGNVLIFVAPGTEAATVASAGRHLVPGGLIVVGFQVRPGGYGPDALDEHAAAAGLDLVARWSTWGREPHDTGSDYQVSVHRLAG